MKTIQFRSSIVYYDGPQVFAASDKIGGNYVCALIGPSRYGGESFMAVGVSLEHMAEFEAGRLDLRSLLLTRDDPDWYIGVVPGSWTAPIVLHRQEVDISQSDDLPDEGFFVVPEEEQLQPVAKTLKDLFTAAVYEGFISVSVESDATTGQIITLKSDTPEPTTPLRTSMKPQPRTRRMTSELYHRAYHEGAA